MSSEDLAQQSYDGDVDQPAEVDPSPPEHAVDPVFLDDLEIPADETDAKIIQVSDGGEV